VRAHQVNGAVSEAASMLFFNADEATQNLVAFYKQNTLAQFNQQAQVLTQRFPEGSLLQLAVIGADGYMVYSNLSSQERVYLGDREHFKVHVDNSNSGLFISKPLMGKVSKKWTIQFTRRIEDKGKFMGVLVLSLSPDYLFHTLERLTRDSQDVLLILRNSGEVMARSRDMDKAIGVTSAEGRPYLSSTPGEIGQFTARGSIDQVERIYHWHHLDDYPALVVLGLDMAALMAPVEMAIWQERLKGLISTAAVWLTALLAVFLSLRMQAHIQKRVEYEYAAMHDTLTGLKNRKALINHLEQRLLAAQTANERLAVLFIDLDGFKQINDRYGHPAGDTVLRTAAQRIKACARNSDLVARLGGDEFVIVCNDLRQANDVQILVDRIHEAMSAPIELDKQPLSVGASTGVALYPEQGQTPDALLAAADEAMYQNKAQRKSRQAAVAAA
jgi:diguanylate cyclase (GGDEF)-like protein